MEAEEKFLPWGSEAQTEREYEKLTGRFINYFTIMILISVIIPSFMRFSIELTSRFDLEINTDVYELLLVNLRSLRSAMLSLGMASSGGLLLTLLFPLIQEAWKRPNAHLSPEEEDSWAARIIYISQIQKFTTFGLLILFSTGFSMSLPWLSAAGWENLGTSVIFLALSIFACALLAALPLLSKEVHIRRNRSRRRISFYEDRLLRSTPRTPSNARATIARICLINRCDIWIPLLAGMTVAFGSASIIFRGSENPILNIIIIILVSMSSFAIASCLSSFSSFLVLKMRARRSSQLIRPQENVKSKFPQEPKQHGSRRQKATQEPFVSIKRDGTSLICMFVLINLLSSVILFTQISIVIPVYTPADIQPVIVTAAALIIIFGHQVSPFFRRLSSTKCQHELTSLLNGESRTYRKIDFLV